MGSEVWLEAPLKSRLLRIDGGRSPDLPDTPAAAGGWGVLKVSAVHRSGFRPGENKEVSDVALVDERYEVQAGDLLISRANTPELVGSACIATSSSSRLLLSDKTLRLVVDQELADARFVNFSLSSPALRSQIENAASGSSRSMQNISQLSIERLMLPWPPIAEQRRIVGVLDAVSVEEDSIGASIAKIHAVRQGILLSSMPLDVQAVPLEGWVRVPLKVVVPSTDYGISEALVSDPQGMPVLRMNNIRDGRVDADELRYCPTSVPDRLVLRHGDVLFNRTNSIEHVGKAAMWKDDLPKATFASYLVRLNPDLRQITPEYLVEWLQHPLIRQRVKAISTVAVQQVNVNPTRLRDLEIDLPVSLDEQRRIVSLLAACDDRIRREEEGLAKLRKLKIGLVDDLLAGRAVGTE
ncbi:restriction endonuclease subunit S [Streptomyces atratus]|uniref:restriction endonuclease subunit S n=1 Tax=Streptomyces atratus TaxID=1893 RepID=UPI00325269FE